MSAVKTIGTGQTKNIMARPISINNILIDCLQGFYICQTGDYDPMAER
jgi:hypothetical protein